jgi:hypothetical protein
MAKTMLEEIEEIKMTEAKPLTRSEKEAKIKDKAGWVITVVAALLAFNTYIANGISSTVLNNTIKANDTWAFYQAKSIKQSMYDLAADDADARGEKAKADKYRENSARYESEPATGEGKKELMAKARQLEADRDSAKKKSPWLTFAGTAYQLAIVLLSASILAVSMPLFWGSLAASGVGLFLMNQGIWLFLPL